MFLTNPFIQSIAQNPRWTVSTMAKSPEYPKIKPKTPIDFNSLMATGKIRGASFKDGNWPLVDLYTIYRYIPDTSNVAYMLDVSVDRHIVLDIEPECPAGIRDSLLLLPFEYAETSMSGKGLHLGFTLNDSFTLNLSNRVVIKEPHKWYEFLLRHYVTFTGRECFMPQPYSNQQELCRLIGSIMTENPKPGIRPEKAAEKMPDIPNAKNILRALDGIMPPASLEECGNDMSKYDWKYAWRICNRMKRMTSNGKLLIGRDYTYDEEAWLLYMAMENLFEPRDKYKEIRDGTTPFLLWQAENVLTAFNKDNEEKQKNKKERKKGKPQ